MKRIKNVLIGIAVVSLFVMPLVYANNGYGNMGKEKRFSSRRHGEIKEIFRELNLTDDQKKQLEANKTENREKAKQLFSKMKSYRDELNSEFMKPELDMAKINAIQAQLKEIEIQMIDDRFNSILGVRQILTPEQFEKFTSLTRDRRNKQNKAERKAE